MLVFRAKKPEEQLGIFKPYELALFCRMKREKMLMGVA